MIPKSLAKLQRFPGLYAEAKVRKAATLRAFDDVVTAPLHGYRDVDDYWTRASTIGELHRIRVNTLLIHARNDPFLPGKFLPSNDVADCVTCAFSPAGGHVGFVSGPFPGNQHWLPTRILDYFSLQRDLS
jgi:predicted alpha/beta-fold hydrolase